LTDTLNEEIKVGQSSKNRKGRSIHQWRKSLMRCQGLDIFQIVCPDTGFFPPFLKWRKNGPQLYHIRLLSSLSEEKKPLKKPNAEQK
jgi:hypothetical protein